MQQRLKKDIEELHKMAEQESEFEGKIEKYERLLRELFHFIEQQNENIERAIQGWTSVGAKKSRLLTQSYRTTETNADYDFILSNYINITTALNAEQKKEKQLQEESKLLYKQYLLARNTAINILN